MAANTADFLGGGGEFVSPFGNAPVSSDPDDQPNPRNPGGVSNNTLRAQQEQYAASPQFAAGQQLKAQDQAGRATPQNATSGYENAYQAERAGMSLDDYHAMRAGERKHSQGRSVMRNIINDPWTLGVLSAPYAVLGGGAAVGGASALGFGSAAAAGGGAAAAPAIASVGPASGAVTAGSTATTIPLATGGGAAAGGAAAGGGAAAAPAAAGGITAGNVIDGLGLATQIGMTIYDQQKSAAEKALIRKQEQMAAEAAQHREQMQTAAMNSLGQRILAFNPQNQMMARMYGAESAFAPEQFAAMGENPMKPAQLSPELMTNGGQGDPAKEAQVADYKARVAAFDQEEAKRRQKIMGGMTPVAGLGPKPIQQRAPQAARRF